MTGAQQDNYPFAADDLETAYLGIGVSRNLSVLDKNIATALLILSERRGSASGSACKLAEGFGITEERVYASLRRLEARGLIKVIYEPDIAALIAQGDDFRANRERLGDDEES